MSAFIAAIFTAALAENIVLTKMLGLCPYINLAKRARVAAGAGAATTLVLTVACALVWGINLALPAPLHALQPLLFIAVIAAIVSATELLMRVYTPLLHRALGVFLPLIATNCAVLGVILLMLRREDGGGFVDSIAAGLGGGLGFTMATLLLALIGERTVDAQVPAAFRGAPLAMISTGIMALAVAGAVTATVT